MFKKTVLAILVLTVVGSASAAVAYNLGQDQSAPQVVGESLAAQDNPTSVQNNRFGGQGQGQTNSPEPMAEGMVGEPFTARAAIVSFDLNGMDVILEDGTEAFIELGPGEFWQAQEVALIAGEEVLISGMVDGDMYHAVTITNSTGDTLTLRTDDGQPLWSGGVSNARGQGSQDGTHTTDPQAVVDEWVTLTGTIVTLTNGQMTIEQADGTLVSFQTGQPRFLQSQGVTFSPGEEIQVVGFYTEGTFSAGDITQLSTGAKVLLRDPNGRPLWAGPGAGNGNGNGGSHTTEPAG